MSFWPCQSLPTCGVAGDCTAVLDDKTGTSHPLNAQHGLREGLIAAKNIEATILGKRMKPFTFTLRVLQEGQFEKLGEDRTRTVDVPLSPRQIATSPPKSKPAASARISTI